jgi:protein-tyrosine phosphatase
MKHILTLCIGNICRSPIAEALLKQQFPEKTIWSAGLGALVGNPADPLSIEVAAAHGVDLSAHRAQQLAGWMCQTAELILVMEQDHKTGLEQQYPLTRGKVFRLGEPGKYDIEDPYRQPRAAFEAAYAAIAQGVADWAPRIRQLG